MKTIFYNHPIGTKKVCFTVSEKSVTELKKEGVIPHKAVSVSYDLIDENSSEELRTLTSFPDRCEFDNMKKPTKVVVDLELIHSFVLTEIKEARNICLTDLDEVQVRYMAMGNADKVASIEADKQTLRDLPNTLDFSKATTYSESMLVGNIPALTEDYKVKYA
tara:strand:+ start:58 stop:546 length:489 start_codon:yes stop_codon:yes gene_type:complete